ncbi:glycosyltransferase [Roseibium sp. SCP14]|uniref:glycosyltransferase n=1 Tax=Roseibium sp. SCP14 TaxID=3141375 RepID=UPI00333C3FB3
MAIIFQLRYSIIVNDRKDHSTMDFKIASGLTFDEYASALFSPERLDVHEHMFKHITLPSLLRQMERFNDHKVRLFIYVSELLPKEYRQRLDRMIDGHSCIELIAVNPDHPPNFSQDVERFLDSGDESARAQRKVTVATARIDDDDAVSRNYLKNLSLFLRPEYSGMCVSFINGYLATFGIESGKLEEIIDYCYPFNAQGLAFINVYDASSRSWEHDPKTVLELGSHLKVCERVPVICDGRQPSFLLVHHPESDSFKREYLKKLLDASERTDPAKIQELFELDSEVLQVSSCV